ncbi:hypothetical protein N7466_002204 [Penicillium verhagenii]|uniref:uncharacterized protein n=1 Tax=Penicillium verhagenii TaxID=1562060 RepID=UPI002545801D|nr:uncharacterized protein N7466_002204 [Penicillium verhagenii]KAJ5939070.1 hypothetical protein N7466_002204 [Penicillium verhagenii]
MDSQDGITVRPMRLKVLYTFDNENKTNCLARWPHVLEIQTAYLDENTPVGVIELKTCIQAIVSASPELVAQLGKDYTVYAYDYSEYETPLVGQGMLSWVLASSSPTPEAPAHQSKTMVTGRVCKAPLGLFSKGAGAQETLEVKLRLVPVPNIMQSQYLDSMQKYRELSNVIPHDFDAQSWTAFMRQNPSLMEAARNQSQDRASAVSPMSGSGIGRFHQILSDGATPREFSGYERNDSVRSVSPTHSYGAPSRVSTPGGVRTSTYQPQPQHQSRPPYNQSSDMIRPSSSASMRDNDYQVPQSLSRRDSIQSGYASGGEDIDPQPRKRAKLYQAGWPGKSDMNIERQPSSLRVAASTAASVRIHRPTPVNPAIAAEQSINEPVRPPTPIMRPGDGSRRRRPASSMLRESSVLSSYASPYFNSDDIGTDFTSHSPDDSRYQGLFEPPFNMPSSPPIMDTRAASKSSPVLPPITLDTDSGFMSGGMEENLEDEVATPVEDGQRAESHGPIEGNHSLSVRSTVQPNSPVGRTGTVGQSNDFMPMSDPPTFPPRKPKVQSRPASAAGSRPSSGNGVRLAPKIQTPNPCSEISQNRSSVPPSDPIVTPNPPPQHAITWTGPVTGFDHDGKSVSVPVPQAENPEKPKKPENLKPRGLNRRVTQIQQNLDEAIKSGKIPPFCENCGSIETPTWRRAWSRDIMGGEGLAKQMMMQVSGSLFYMPLERDASKAITNFKFYKKTLLVADDDSWVQVLLCNPCGLWLHKMKTMRPENKWNKSASDGNKKRPIRNRRSGGPLSVPSARTRSMVASSVTAASSPAPTEASSIQPDEGATPQLDDSQDQDQGQDEEGENYPNKRRRANSVEPRRSTESSYARWEHDDAVEALRRAIQSSPARNMKVRPQTERAPSLDETNTTPKPLRRALFASSHNEKSLKELGPSLLNGGSPRRSPKTASHEHKQPRDKENIAPTPNNDLNDLFESPSVDLNLLTSPTPRRPHARFNMHERRLSLPSNSPNSTRHKDVGKTPSPTRLTAERLQHIQDGQDSPRTTPRQNRSPNKQRSPNKHDFSTLLSQSLHTASLQPFDSIILDILDDTPVQPDFFQIGEGSKGESHNWADWLPEAYVSPTASEENLQGSEDFINSLLSGPTALKENLHDKQFNPFNFDVELPDSGFFSSDAQQTDPLGSSNVQSSKEKSNEQPATSPAA